MLEDMSANQLREWMEYDSLEPIGIQGHLIGHATTASTLANVNRDSKSRPEPFSILDFMPETFRPLQPPVDEEEANKQAAIKFKEFMLARYGSNKGAS